MKKRAFTAVLALIFALLLLPSTATAGSITGDAWFYDVPGGFYDNLHFEFEPVTTPDGETVYIVEFELTTKDDGDGVPVPSRPGYIFLGWKSETDGKIYNYGDTLTFTWGSYSSDSFYAVWANMPEIEPTQPDTPDEPDISYDDVSADAWYYDAVEYVSKNGIMNGMGESVFQPDADLNRAMIWTMLARLDGADTEGGDSWYSVGQEWAVAAGVSDGTDPMGDVTREQLITMLYRYAVYKGQDVSVGEETNILSYADADQVSEWAISAFQWACGAGIIEGDENGLITPTATATRAQAAAILMRSIEV